MELIEYKPLLNRFETEFIPTFEQLAFAEAYVECHGNVTQASFIAGDRCRNWHYRWCRECKGYEEWLQTYAKERVLKRIGKWYLILEKFAERGSFPHLDRLFEIAKEFLPDHKPNLVVNVYPQKTIVFRDIGPDDINRARNNSGNAREGAESVSAQGEIQSS